MPYKLFFLLFLPFLITSCGNNFRDGGTAKSFGGDGMVVVGFQSKVFKEKPKYDDAHKKILITKPEESIKKPDKKKLSNIEKNDLYVIQQEWKNTPYVIGGTSINGADCSGFIQTVYKEEFGVMLPRTTIELMKKGVVVAKNKLKVGDLVFFYTGAAPHGYHVGIYITNGLFVHLSSHGGARIQNLNMKYWKTKYITARRYSD